LAHECTLIATNSGRQDPDENHANAGHPFSADIADGADDQTVLIHPRHRRDPRRLTSAS
jgi:hypothetical protein